MNKSMLKFFRKIFSKQNLSQEAIEAYFHRLPDRINVRWKRDSDFIVGWITTEDNEFMTQGRDAKDFIEMVNDAVYTYYEIPEDYVDVLSKFKSYNPPLKEVERLRNNDITEYSFGFRKNEEILRTFKTA